MGHRSSVHLSIVHLRHRRGSALARAADGARPARGRRDAPLPLGRLSLTALLQAGGLEQVELASLGNWTLEQIEA